MNISSMKYTKLKLESCKLYRIKSDPKQGWQTKFHPGVSSLPLLREIIISQQINFIYCSALHLSWKIGVKFVFKSAVKSYITITRPWLFPACGTTYLQGEWCSVILSVEYVFYVFPTYFLFILFHSPFSGPLPWSGDGEDKSIKSFVSWL